MAASPSLPWVISAALTIGIVYELLDTWRLLPQVPGLIGHDLVTYKTAAREWTTTGHFYPPSQLAGPFEVREREILYPPFALALFVPFIVLPDVLWWTVPLVITGTVVASWRPRPWAWATILLLVALPITSFTYSATLDMVFNGNPVMWIVMFVALATRFPFFGPFALLKPTPLLIPFSLIGVRKPAWWLGLATLLGVAVVLLPMWSDYVRVLGNARGAGLVYGPSSVFPVLIPVVAWIGSRNRDDAAHGSKLDAS